MDECPDSLQTCGVLLTKYYGVLPLNGLLADMNRYSLKMEYVSNIQLFNVATSIVRRSFFDGAKLQKK